MVDPEDLPPIFPSKKCYIDINVISKNGVNLKALFGYSVYVQSYQLEKTNKWVTCPIKTEYY